MKLLQKIWPGFPNSHFDAVQSALDSQYHKAVTDEEAEEYGHVYYNLIERYQRISKEK
jgi:hypothetical protein